MRNELPGQRQALTPKIERISSLLFVGVLLFATLVVPGIALTTQWAMDVPTPAQKKAQAENYDLSAAEQQTLASYQHGALAHRETGSGGRQCAASSSLGANSIFTGLCTETVN